MSKRLLITLTISILILSGCNYSSDKNYNNDSDLKQQKQINISNNENLKSYTSNNFGIKFSFPNIWLIKEKDNSILIERFVKTEDEELEIFFAKFEYIDDLDNIGGTINGEPISVDINSFDTIIINDVLWYKGNCFGQSCMGNEEFYLTQKPNNKYLLVEIMSGFTDDFEKMVNSIEFIKK